MAKIDDVNQAVEDQLTAENRWPPNDDTKNMGTDYHYNENDMTIFLRRKR